MRFWWQHQGPPDPARTVKAGVGMAIGIALAAGLAEWTALPLLITSFGSTSVMLFLMPELPYSQPMNIVGGHVVAAAVGLAADAVLPSEAWWAYGLAVGASLIAMAAVRVMHPPAGANPLIVMFAHPDFDFLLIPVLAGTVLLVALAVVVHRLPPKATAYPTPDTGAPPQP
ncbi:MAG: HPP family protein [Alphaproteobacteria bacterium]|nr:HPP family protein [Alphaproteobacteria bacterium]